MCQAIMGRHSMAEVQLILQEIILQLGDQYSTKIALQRPLRLACFVKALKSLSYYLPNMKEVTMVRASPTIREITPCREWCCYW